MVNLSSHLLIHSFIICGFETDLRDNLEVACVLLMLRSRASGHLKLLSELATRLVGLGLALRQLLTTKKKKSKQKF